MVVQPQAKHGATALWRRKLRRVRYHISDSRGLEQMKPYHPSRSAGGAHAELRALTLTVLIKADSGSSEYHVSSIRISGAT
eukprot:scaffold217538_cov30-Tisochrysis_lutea.AAC.3